MSPVPRKQGDMTAYWVRWLSEDGRRHEVHAYDGRVNTTRAACGEAVPYWSKRVGRTSGAPSEYEFPGDASVSVCPECLEEVETG